MRLGRRRILGCKYAFLVPVRVAPVLQLRSALAAAVYFCAAARGSLPLEWNGRGRWSTTIRNNAGGVGFAKWLARAETKRRLPDRYSQWRSVSARLVAAALAARGRRSCFLPQLRTRRACPCRLRDRRR